MELPGDDHHFYVGETEAMLAEIQQFLTGMRTVPEIDRVLATVLFTDIVASTQRADDVALAFLRAVLNSAGVLSIGRRMGPLLVNPTPADAALSTPF